MATKKQIAANRRNAKHCTGPKTAAGKAVCSMNALRHGLYSSTLVLPGEDQAQFDNLRGGLQDLYQPQDAHQQQLVDELAATRWKMLRAELCEARLLMQYGDSPVTDYLAQYDRINQAQYRLHRVWFKLYQELSSIQIARAHRSTALTTSSKCCVSGSAATAPAKVTPVPEKSSPVTHYIAHNAALGQTQTISFSNTA